MYLHLYVLSFWSNRCNVCVPESFHYRFLSSFAKIIILIIISGHNLHRLQQLSCCNLCKFVTWSDHYFSQKIIVSVVVTRYVEWAQRWFVRCFPDSICPQGPLGYLQKLSARDIDEMHHMSLVGIKLVWNNTHWFVMPPPLGAGGIMFSGCPSVRPSEAWNTLFWPVHGSVGPPDQP